jgi:hypothetical protein
LVFRYVHTADAHLDSPLSTLALRDPTLAELIGGVMGNRFLWIAPSPAHFTSHFRWYLLCSNP